VSVTATPQAGEQVVSTYSYDGLGRRVQEVVDTSCQEPPLWSESAEDDYYAGQQVVETRDAGGDVQYQYLWSPRYTDAPILRDTYQTVGDQQSIALPQRVFYLADANYNVTGLLKYDSGSGTWQVVERYTYTPYGAVTYRNADWTTASSSANNNTILYTGRTLDLSTGLYYYRARYYDAVLERFINRDPIGYKGGLNLYEYVKDDPVKWIDPSGLCPPGFSLLSEDEQLALGYESHYDPDVGGEAYWGWGAGSNNFLGHFPSDEEWSSDFGTYVEWGRIQCTQTETCVRKRPSSSTGEVISTKVGGWQYVGLTPGTIVWLYGFSGSVGSSLWSRTIVTTYGAMEEWDIVKGYKCITDITYRPRTELCDGTYYIGPPYGTSHWERMVYYYVGTVTVPASGTTTRTTTEFGNGMAWEDGKTFDIWVTDPDGQNPRVVDNNPPVPPGM
jgi:RHS repeat-associated protein